MERNIEITLEELKLNRRHIEAIKEASDFIKLEEDEDQILTIEIDERIAYDLYCDELLESKDTTKITAKDILYTGDNYSRAYKMAGYHNRTIKEDDFDVDCVSDLSAMVCYIVCKVNDYKYSSLESIDDITEPIPLQVFTELINKNKEGYKVAIKEEENEFAGILNKIIIEKSMFGINIYGVINIISKGPEGYVRGDYCIDLPLISFVSGLEDLGFTIVEENSELHTRLTERGNKYVEVTKEPKYCEYHGHGYSESWRGDVRHRLDSRVMIDISAFKMLNSRTDSSWFVGNAAYSENVIGNTVEEKDLWRCSPVVYGFSFNNKVWCKMNLDNISEIVFSDKAFDDLIIPEENKAVFTAALTHDMPSLDSISDKGAGKIFLLYGAPGVGKTMTAEAVAEFLQKPLYFVSVGELGVNPKSLEESLEKVMRIAESWDAIVLLDEVDVFAVDRIGASIERNAMTAIFLRMLERYSGIMFMTTNLKDNLDPAFVSRATATIEYKNLTAKDRECIWNGVLEKAKALNQVTIDPSVYEAVREHALIDMNGRVIKNTIRLAYTLALTTEDKVLRNNHIVMAIKLRG